MSDESDREDHMASERDDELDEYGSDESGSEATNELLDVEAVESDGQSDDETADYFDDAEPCFFHQFCLLPIELRQRVWEFFDPNLTSKARVLEVAALSSPEELWPGATLEQQTEPARTMLAIHKESRDLVLKHYPDTFHLHSGRTIVHFNGERDIILLYGPNLSGLLRSLLQRTILPANLKNIAFDWNQDEPPDSAVAVDMMALEAEFSVRIYCCHDACTFASRELQHFVSDSARKFYAQTREEESGLGEDAEYMYCWHDRQVDEDSTEETPKLRNMVKFSFGEGLRRYDKIKNAMLMEGAWEDKWESSESGSESGSEPDEYEIDGFVVDSESEEGEGSGDDEVEDGDGDMGGEPGLDDNVSSFNGFSPLHDEDSDLRNGDDLPVAHFSSLEPESPRTDDSDAPDSEAQPARMTNRSKRRILSSDDEDGSEDGHDDEPVKHARPNKRARVVLSDSEDEGEADEDDRPIRNGGDAREEDETSQASSDSDEEEDEEEDSDEEPVKAKPLSLLDKLRQFRSDNPISPSGSDDGSVASAGLDGARPSGGKFQDYSDRYDDDDDDDEDDGMDAGEEDGLVADMAEEDFNDEDEGEGESGW
ncbi:hypothetical protein F5X99DRAFT_369778 [Biscogniauxia marginata]|nr:hypothetical protein F5X99DRAFT_369778 [Biscogniauxia marginata]